MERPASLPPKRSLPAEKPKSRLAVASTIQSPHPTSDMPYEPPVWLPVALALEVERVVVIILAIAVAADMRLAQRYHLRDLTSETSCLHPLLFQTNLCPKPHHILFIFHH